MIIEILKSPFPLMAIIFSIVIFFGALRIGLTTIEEKMKLSKRKAYWAGRNGRANTHSTKADFAADQLKRVSGASFTGRALFNRSEAKVFEALEEAVKARNPHWRVMGQVSLGEFLASPDKGAFLAVNSKRVDFVLMDQNCRVVHALEYQGSGHHTGSSAAARDAVKKEALRKAGVGYHEVVAGKTTPSELKALVQKLVPGVAGASERAKVAAIR